MLGVGAEFLTWGARARELAFVAIGLIEGPASCETCLCLRGAFFGMIAADAGAGLGGAAEIAIDVVAFF